MLALFRRNLFVNYLFLLGFAVVCLMPYLIKPDWLAMHDFQMPYHEVFEWNLPWINTVYGQLFYALIFIYVQSIMVAEIVIQNRLSRQLSIIPAAVFCFFCFWALHNSVLDEVLLANFFLILCFRSLFDIYKKYKPISTLFNAGFFLALAVLVYSPLIFFFIICFFGLLSLRSLKLTEFLQLSFGFLCPIFLAWVALFYKSNTALLWDQLSLEFSFPNLTDIDIPLIIKLTLLLLTLAFLVSQNSELLKKKTFDAIKKIELSYWGLLLSLVSLFFVKELSQSHLLSLSIPLSILAGLYLESRDKMTIKEFAFLFYIIFYFLMVFEIV